MKYLSLRKTKTPAGSLEPAFLELLASTFNPQLFVETGTFLGHTSKTASLFFKDVHTIELSPKLAAQAAANFATSPHVHTHQGDSTTVLPGLLSVLDEPALFWLDGHYSEGPTAKGSSNTPIIDEIQAISEWRHKRSSVVLVDDLRLFDGGTRKVDASSSLHGYPTIKELQAALLSIDAGFQFHVYGDIALAFHADACVDVTALIKSMTVSRMCEALDIPIESVLAAERIIARPEGAEKDALLELRNISGGIEQHGRGAHYLLWQGLVRRGGGKALDACRLFSDLIRMGFSHWRIKWYLAETLGELGEGTLAIELLDDVLNHAPDFRPALRLKESLLRITPARPLLTSSPEPLTLLRSKGLHAEGAPLRLHLGCGEQHLEGYVNIDYPPSEHSVQKRVAADAFADISTLRFPPNSIDEIRSHHVFEHFTRVKAVGLLILWQECLKLGGLLRIETPDVVGCAQQLADSTIPFKARQAVLRHLFGSQEARWAIHYDGWSEEKFVRVLEPLGFTVSTKAWRWPAPPYLSNVEAQATKRVDMNRASLLEAADDILADAMINDVPAEQTMWQAWRKDLRDFLAGTPSA